MFGWFIDEYKKWKGIKLSWYHKYLISGYCIKTLGDYLLWNKTGKLDVY